MVRSFKAPSRDQGQVTVVEDNTVPAGFGRFTLAGEVVGTLARGSFPLPDKWDTMRVTTFAFEEILAWEKEAGVDVVIICLDG